MVVERKEGHPQHNVYAFDGMSDMFTIVSAIFSCILYICSFFSFVYFSSQSTELIEILYIYFCVNQNT